MLCEVYSDRLEVSERETVRMHRAPFTDLVTQSKMQVADLAKDVSFEEPYEVVCQTVIRRLVLDTFWLGIVSRILHLILTQVRYQLLIPANEVNIAIKVTT